LALGCENITFTGQGRLPERPFDTYCDIFDKFGIEFSSRKLPMTVSGALKSGTYRLPGNISSQFISGLLLALSIIPGESTIELTSVLESKPYVDMTVNELKAFGADIKETDKGYLVMGKDHLIATERTVEGDWSQAAFFLVAGAINGDVTVKGLDMNSLQGDKAILNLLKDFGAHIELLNDGARVKKSQLYGITIDASQIPDLVPVLAVAAALAKGTTIIKNAERLKIKESDRLFETAARLQTFGIEAKETSDGLIIKGSAPHGADITSANDHRIVMAFSVLSSVAEGVSTISDPLAINKSYPNFFEDFLSVGGDVNVF
jgi:3-phosphoshikimate 1-carboxyvinyltransferase